MKERGIKAVSVLAAALIVLAVCPAVSAEVEPKLTVLTFNIWGITGAKARVIRAEAIGRRIAALDPDIVAIEEAFEKRHRKVLFESLAKGGYEFADSRYFRKLYGSGVLFISKYPIESALFEPYRVNAAFYDIERLGGKGIAHLRLATPWGPLDFFHTHALARMTPVFDNEGNYIPGDPKHIDRLLQMYQIDRFVRGQKNPRARSIIAAGDFNVSPEMLEYRFLSTLTGFENSFDAIHPGKNPSTFSPNCVFVKDDYSRIDHIFYKNFEGPEGFWLKPTSSRVEMVDRFTNPKNLKEINYSDHYGLLTEFEVIEEGGASPSPAGVVSLECPCCNGECPLQGYSGGVLEITSANFRSWQDVALDVFRVAYEKKERENDLIPPMARVVEWDPSSDPIKIEIPSNERKAWEKRVCGGECESKEEGKKSVN